MATRNTAVLVQVIEALGDLVSSPTEALARLEQHFEGSLLIEAGNLTQVARYAALLGREITGPEAVLVLDHIAHKALARLTIDQVEEAIQSLFPGRTDRS